MSIEQLFPGRLELLRTLRSTNWCDVLVIGGGIHGACAAHLAAFNGLRTILLEAGDYAGETSSRSSKLAHGGLRYLELLDFAQVFEGIRAREDLLTVAPHLVSAQEFAVAIEPNDLWRRLLLGAGLTLYDALSGFRRRHRWEKSPGGGGRYFFTDGIMRDAQLVLERIIAARQEGALCLNYVRVDRVLAQKNERVLVHCTDVTAAQGSPRIEIEAGVVLNCAGPFAAALAVPQAHMLQKHLTLSRGAHVLFDVAWQGHPQILAIKDSHGKRRRGRYYFVLPCHGRTMVGTTERHISNAQFDSVPTREEIDEIFTRVNNDLAGRGLVPERAYYAFVGTRALYGAAGVGDSEHTARMSRKHRWVYSAGVLSLIGGKYTTAMHTAQDGLKTAFRMAGLKRKVISLSGRLLPGAAHLEEERKIFMQACQAHAVRAEITQRVLSRMGSRVRYIREVPNGFELIGGEILRGELVVMLHMEQANSLSDILRRRLEFELLPGHGLQLVEPLCEALKEIWPERDLEQQAQQYRERVRSVLAVLGKN